MMLRRRGERWKSCQRSRFIFHFAIAFVKVLPFEVTEAGVERLALGAPLERSEADLRLYERYWALHCPISSVSFFSVSIYLVG